MFRKNQKQGKNELFHYIKLTDQLFLQYFLKWNIWWPLIWLVCFIYYWKESKIYLCHTSNKYTYSIQLIWPKRQLCIRSILLWPFRGHCWFLFWFEFILLSLFPLYVFVCLTCRYACICFPGVFFRNNDLAALVIFSPMVVSIEASERGFLLQIYHCS